MAVLIQQQESPSISCCRISAASPATAGTAGD